MDASTAAITATPEEDGGNFECSPPSISFDRDRHVTYLEMMYQLVPSPYQSQEINRLTLAYFVISGLHLLNALDRIDKVAVTDWVLSFQDHPTKKNDAMNSDKFYGFHGSRTSQYPSEESGMLDQSFGHLASTYSALAILKIIGHEFSYIGSEVILTSMRSLQQPDGRYRKIFVQILLTRDTKYMKSINKTHILIKRVTVNLKSENVQAWSFMPIHAGAEKDLRFVYCAAAICVMLDNWSGMDREKAKNYILDCHSYDGGFGLVPGSESHGGATYCAVASLRLMGYLEDNVLSKSTQSYIIDVQMLLDWCLQRQAGDGGFQGRPNKPSDTCYAFWVWGVLKMLGGHKFIDSKVLREFLRTCESKYGGYSKFPGELPDLYHSYYGFTAMSILQEPGLNPLCIELGITDPTAFDI